MPTRVGVLLVVSGLTLAFVLGPVLFIAGLFLAVCGGIVGAVGMESELARERVEPGAQAEAADHERCGATERSVRWTRTS
jgi:hypothetical protein